MTRRALAVVVVGGLAVAGCGERTPTSPPRPACWATMKRDTALFCPVATGQWYRTITIEQVLVDCDTLTPLRSVEE